MGYWPFSHNERYADPNHPTAYSVGSQANFDLLNKYGNPAQVQSLQNLLGMLQNQGRVDPRLLASAQALNARSTQQQQDAARGNAAGRGFGGGGLSAALQASIGAAGANRAANLNYQDIADSYARNQANIGLVNQVVTQPQMGYASLSADLYKAWLDAEQQGKAARVSALGAGISSGLGAGGKK